MVEVDPVAVEADLVAGRLVCPDCGARLAPWGNGRDRELRSRAGDRLFRPRRSICAGCGATHVLLPDDSLCAGVTQWPTSAVRRPLTQPGRGTAGSPSTLAGSGARVRGWLRRFEVLAGRVREHFTRWAVALDPMLGPIRPAGSGFADAVEAVGVAAAAAVRRLGPCEPWRFASAATGGRLLSNTSRPWPGPL